MVQPYLFRRVQQFKENTEKVAQEALNNAKQTINNFFFPEQMKQISLMNESIKKTKQETEEIKENTKKIQAEIEAMEAENKPLEEQNNSSTQTSCRIS